MGQIAIIGMGQLGRQMAEGWLAAGQTVVPVLRGGTADQLPNDVQAVLVATGEDDLSGALASIPSGLKDRVILLQNELVPPQWQSHKIENPTVFVVWFEKKAGKLVKSLLPSVVYGPQAPLVASSLDRLGLPYRVADNWDDLLFELAVKNVYILTTNIAGLSVGGTTGELWSQRRDFTLNIMDEILSVQRALMEHDLDRGRMMEALAEGLNVDPNHGCGGRSAKRRLARLLQHAQNLHLSLPHIEQIAQAVPLS